MANYFDPAFNVQINGTSLKADVSKNIQQVSIVSQPDTMDSFSLTLANEYPVLRWTHTGDADLFQQGSAVKVYMGYVDDLQEMIDGQITKISPSFPDSGMPTLTVEGNTRMHWLHASKTTRTFQKMTDTQIVQQIAQEAGLDTQADDTKVQYDYVMQANQTDLEFIRDRAKRIHFEVLVKGMTLIFRKANEIGTKIYTLVWGHTQAAFSAGSNILPLKNFSTSMNTLQPPTEVEVRGYDIKNKKEFVGKAATGEEDTRMSGNMTGSEARAGAFHKPRKFVRVNVPVASQAEADQQAKAILNNLAMEFLTGSGSTIGVPDLRSGSVVELEGLGRFSGQYYIDTATHRIGASGYQTDFTVKRNAI